MHSLAADPAPLRGHEFHAPGPQRREFFGQRTASGRPYGQAAGRAMANFTALSQACFGHSMAQPPPADRVRLVPFRRADRPHRRLGPDGSIVGPGRVARGQRDGKHPVPCRAAGDSRTSPPRPRAVSRPARLARQAARPESAPALPRSTRSAPCHPCESSAEKAMQRGPEASPASPFKGRIGATQSHPSGAGKS